MRPGKARTNTGESSRMNPARQTRSTSWARRRSTRASSYRSRDGQSLCERTSVGTPAARARSSPGAPSTFDSTTPTRASSFPSRIASNIAWRFEPRPLIRMPSVLKGLKGSKTPLVGDTRARNDFANGPAAGNSADVFRSHDQNHPHPQVERPEHVVLRHRALLHHVAEDRLRFQRPKIDANAESFTEHAGDVVGKTTAGDMGHRVDDVRFEERLELSEV